MEREDDDSSWVVRFAHTEFFHNCHNHMKHRKYYCCECLEALCEDCSIRNHKSLGHSVLQVRRASHRDSIHIKDVQSRSVDPSHIQKIVINNEYAMYLKPNTKNNGNKNGININNSKKCDTCGSITKPDSKFCSLACKVTCHSGSTTNVVDNSSLNGALVHEFIRKRKVVDDHSQRDPHSWRKRSRKQRIPRRSAMF